MNVLVIGSGGREHAICYSLRKSSVVDKLYAMPGNPGMAKIAEIVSGNVEDIAHIKEFCLDHEIGLCVVGPENPLCLGLADVLREAGILVFGPSQKAAMLEGSKAYAKDFMTRHHIPTASYIEADDYDQALKAIKKFSYPLVVKADGLAAGKGVVICENEDMARKTLDDMMNRHSFGQAGNKIVIEEYLEGFECSLLCFTDGKTIVPMVSAKDHKQAYDGNTGPNTGGMGSVSPNPFMPEGINEKLEKEILQPFMAGLKEDQLDYRGTLFIGLMIDQDNNPKVLEFNVRFGDPETQTVLLRLESDLGKIMADVASGCLDPDAVVFNDKKAACLVLCSAGYPGSYSTGKVITGLDDLADDIVVFHAGTKMADGRLVTSGGRVLNLCALADTQQEALDKVYAASKAVHFDGMFYRHDIGLI